MKIEGLLALGLAKALAESPKHVLGYSGATVLSFAVGAWMGYGGMREDVGVLKVQMSSLEKRFSDVADELRRVANVQAAALANAKAVHESLEREVVDHRRRFELLEKRR